MSSMRALLVVLVLVAASAVIGTGPALAQAPEQADLRVVHAVPGGPAVDVFVDGSRAFSGVDYKEATDYAALPAGTHSVRVVPAGAGAQQQALIETTVDLAAGSYNTLAAVGQVGSIQPLLLVNESTLPVTTQASVRAVHASPDAPAVDVAVQGGPVLFSGVTFPSASDYQTVAAGTVNLEIRRAGTDTVVRQVPNVTLTGATVYSIFVVGLAAGQPPLETVVVVDAPPLQTCRTLACPPGAAPGVTATPVTPTPTPSRTPTATPTATGTPVTATPTVTGTPRTATPTVTGTPGTPTVTGTPRTPTATRTGTPLVTTPTVVTPAATTPAPAESPTVEETPQVLFQGLTWGLEVAR